MNRKESEFFKQLILILSIIGILDSIILLLIKGGVNFGTFFPGIAGSFCLGYLKLCQTKWYQAQQAWLKRIERFCWGLMGLWVLSFALFLGLILAKDSIMKQNSNCLLILGAGLQGETPSWLLEERLKIGAIYLTKYPKLKVILSGGRGQGERITEAEAMQRYLVAVGIDPARIIKEERSTSTRENLLFAAQVYQAKFGVKLKKVTILTSDFHLWRAKLIARQQKLSANGIVAPTPWYLYPNVLVREYFAIIKACLFDE